VLPLNKQEMEDFFPSLEVRSMPADWHGVLHTVVTYSNIDEMSLLERVLSGSKLKTLLLAVARKKILKCGGNIPGNVVMLFGPGDWVLLSGSFTL
jgi:hypothetical protein